MLALLKEDTNPISGTLARDGAARTLKTSLAALTLTPLTSGGAAGVPTTLAEIGVTTNRDGTLSVDSDRLSRALTATPDAIEAMFAKGSAATGDGLRSEEHTSELQSLMRNSYAVFCLTKKTTDHQMTHYNTL